MSLMVYKTKKDWENDLGRECDGLGDIDERYYCMVLSDDRGISLFVGETKEDIYVRNSLPKDKLFQLIAFTRKVVNFLDDNGKGIPREVVITEEKEGYRINGELVDEYQPIYDISKDIFHYLCGAEKFIFPSEVKKVYNSQLYFSNEKGVSIAYLLTNNRFKEM